MATSINAIKKVLMVVSLLVALGSSRVFGSEDYRHWFKTPIMGWNDFNDMGLASESQITNAALTFIANGLRDAGYRWIQLDAGWQAGQASIGVFAQQVRDSNGFLSTNCVNFPHGMKWLASWLHARGFYLGLYLGGGDDPLRVFWTNAVQDAQTLADWDIDYIKFDGLPLVAGYLTTFANTIDTLCQSRGRQPIFIRAGFEIGTEWHWSPAELSLANAFNCSGDSYAYADGWRTNFLYDGACTRNVVPPGAIIDEGFWAVSGSTGPAFRDTAATNILTAIRTMMGLNALINGNLTIAKWDVRAGYYLINGSPAVLAIVTNRNVIAIDQDPAQIIGWPVQTNGTSVTWIKPLGSQAGPSWVIGLQNLNTTAGGAAAATFSLTNLPSRQGDTYYAQDVWSTNGFLFSDSFTVTNIEQQMSLYVISPLRLGIELASRLDFVGLTANHNYQVQFLQGGAWADLGSPFVGAGTAYSQYVDGAGIAASYRLVELPIPGGATGTAQVMNGFVVGAIVTSGGSGYVSSPAVRIVGGGGSGATAEAIVSNGVVTGIHIINAGSGYTSTPTIRIDLPPVVSVAPYLSRAFRLDCAGLATNLTYQLQAASSLDNWTNFGPGFTANGTTKSQYLDLGGGSMFYRLRHSP